MNGPRLIFLYFFLIAAMGTVLLSLPAAWAGSGELSLIDAAFTATSAVCVTGLITVDTAMYSSFGKWVILGLIQAGGLGIISFATLLLLIPGRRMSFNNRSMIRNFYVEGVEYDPAAIVRNILLFTFSIEALGAVILYATLPAGERSWFTALFHSVSAFCNAGFSTYSTNLESFRENPGLLFTVAALIVAGGLSFVVLHDVFDTLRRRKPRLSLHSMVVLISTLVLIILGTVLFWFELPHGGQVSLWSRASNAFLHGVSPRTAGFNSLPMQELGGAARLLTLGLMFIGAAPGSMAGGIKVTTIFLILLGIFRGMDDQANSVFLRHRISARAISYAGLFFIKALFLVGLSAGLLLFTEQALVASGRVQGFDLLFESVSAFGTVGLSLGATPLLSQAGKIIIIITMLAGRIGLVFLASDHVKRSRHRHIEYPHGEVLTG